ncbi:undecaprenyl-diphosphatase [Candidatus Roizmanbacteria bacterium CG22_combo_CG10-13_8_21_14_all_35_9]|uniref:Undecaprenyl-diphosphatase n=4 Tax=Candidatus Roizmaniibacteriota TaxID=1752723 RepID=A0A2M8F1X6_9BACT|nr:MAG: undecaprenyl-diphosphatase [Candidatus Roizmanbacteria bacterium CG22_combo_CG10-13_8_21_14_all_35_9]PJC33277.1 MAG: undecaprenyl-diphosphatase [Candidatus Roizmanbacteria bacterium CG_4_9_14_0_2_um_filter_35_15]
MNLIHAFILGIVEGLTEFLPVSSTAHLIIASKFLHISQSEFQAFFEIFIQSGAILAVLFLYFFYVLEHKELWGKIIASFIPTAIVGLVLEKIIKKVFFNSMPLIISSMFLIGLLFIIFELLVKNKKVKLDKSINKMSYLEALIIGLGQSLAVVPGVSRAGIVILTMMGQRFKRDQSAIYSFLLAVPTILAASGLEIIKTDFKVITVANNLLFLGVGFFISLVTAYLVVRWFIGFLQKNSLVVFGVYRLILAIFLLMFLL